MPGHFYHIFASQLVFNKQHIVIIDIFYEKHNFISDPHLGARKDGAVVRALTSDQCETDKFWDQYHEWVLSFMLVLSLRREVFLWVLWFSRSSKINIPKFQFNQEPGTRRITNRSGCVTFNS